MYLNPCGVTGYRFHAAGAEQEATTLSTGLEPRIMQSGIPYSRVTADVIRTRSQTAVSAPRPEKSSESNCQ